MQQEIRTLAEAIRRLEVAAQRGASRLQRAREMAAPGDPLLALYERDVERLVQELVRLRVEHSRALADSLRC